MVERRRLLLMLTALSLVSYVLRSNISVTARLMMPELGLSTAQMGQVFSSFLVGYALCQIPAGVLGDRFGPRRVLGVAVCWWAIATALTGLLPGAYFFAGEALATLLMIRFTLGAAEAATNPVGPHGVGKLFEPSERALANAFVITGLSVGSALTPPVISWVMASAGWRNAMYASAATAVIMSLCWWRFARDTPASDPRPTARSEARSSGGWTMLLQNRSLLVLSLSYGCVGYTLYIFVFWTYLYLVDVRGFGLLTGGLATSVPFLTAAILTPVGGSVADRLSRRWNRRSARRWTAVAGVTLAAGFLAVGATAGSAYVAVAALSLSVGFTEFTEGAYWATATEIAGDHAGAAGGILNTFGNLGGVLSTLAVPWLVSTFGWGVALGSGSLVAVVAGALWFGVRLEPARAVVD